ncbi:hypothetical protein [Pseudomonas amygdali]|uniref:hypothetical protein n=1 Tax=Pseudomonas amygdali TaxID=47877 RepID=UPI00076097A2|nr:hypothetical protein [Pseudomonas amygdali]KWT08199.1 hypothetical protein AL041_22990 [Pseudomonas amygdali pv. aesculi]KWT15017.1 hypothetical protein AL042_08715 [Pseudomonas amygdali pv. aesculi]KWT21772.1 hypothetical protein AL044_27445 [Pseudomonas amygdali pv. aesculi]KWT31039.1 hypothetical protein AL043_10310 [Pseudomonas amygdali pv. aesculi]KWT38873.1 hypothetical protein AMC94_19965 [Pseudomonas amygdali pv. aesculi]
MSEINNKTRFSDLSKKYKALNKTGFLARVFIAMQQEHLKIPDRFKKFYADEIAKSGFIVGTVIGEGIPKEALIYSIFRPCNALEALIYQGVTAGF